MSGYPGGKGAMGAAQHIINNMPPHETYVELFLGMGAVMRTKRKARFSIGVEIDLEVLRNFEAPFEEIALFNQDALNWLAARPNLTQDGEALIYCDPPYLNTKTRQRYKHRFNEEQHRHLLRLIKDASAFVMISGYRSKLYDEELEDWQTYDFQATGRDGKSHTETLWMNYPPQERLHDYRFLGNNFREREAISRRLKRNTRRIAQWPIQQQYALMRSLGEAFREEDF